VRSTSTVSTRLSRFSSSENGNQGIYRVFDGRAEHFRSADGLSSDVVSNIYEDIEGNIWVATSKGIDRFHDVVVASFSAAEGLTTDAVSSVLAARDGTVWIGNEGALDFIRQNVLSRLTARDGLPGRDVTSLFEDHADRLWVGVDSRLAVYERSLHSLLAGGITSDGANSSLTAMCTSRNFRMLWTLTSSISRAKMATSGPPPCCAPAAAVM
jgi:ligand-binding sensor domain-containing protein